MRFLLACQPRNHYLLLVNEFQPKPSSERKGDRLRWKEPACILTFYVLWIEYFVEKSKNITDTLNISSLTARTLPQSPSVTAPSRKEPLARSYSLFDFRLSGKAFIEPRHYGGGFVLQKIITEIFRDYFLRYMVSCLIENTISIFQAVLFSLVLGVLVLLC